MQLGWRHPHSMSCRAAEGGCAASRRPPGCAPTVGSGWRPAGRRCARTTRRADADPPPFYRLLLSTVQGQSSRSASAARPADYVNSRRGRRSAPAGPDSGVTGGPLCGSCAPQAGGSAVWQLGFGRGRPPKRPFSGTFGWKPASRRRRRAARPGPQLPAAALVSGRTIGSGWRAARARCARGSGGAGAGS